MKSIEVLTEGTGATEYLQRVLEHWYPDRRSWEIDVRGQAPYVRILQACVRPASMAASSLMVALILLAIVLAVVKRSQNTLTYTILLNP